MSISFRPILVLIAVAVLNLGIRDSDGFYTQPAFIATIMAMALGIAACLVPARRMVRLGSGRHELAVLAVAIAAIRLGAAAIGSTRLYYAENDAAAARVADWTAWLFGLTAILAIGAIVESFKPKLFSSRLLRIPLTLLLLGGGIGMRAQVIRASPEPIIDVYNLLRDNADHIISGRNPYQHEIVSPYGTARAERFGVIDQPEPRPAGYPPLPFLLCVPSRLLGIDPRWANVIGDCAAAFALAWLGLHRGRPLLGLLTAAIYLNLPRIPFLIEQAWYEPMIAALFGLGLVLAEFERRPKWIGYGLLGLALTAKQFGLPLLFPLAWSHRKNWQLILFALLIGALVILPWFIWSPSAFLDVVLFKHLQRPPQFASITLGSFCANEFGWELPRIVGWLTAAAVIVMVARFTPPGPAAALGLGSALLAFCVCHTQGYINYFFLVQYLWLLGFVASIAVNQSSAENSFNRAENSLAAQAVHV